MAPYLITYGISLALGVVASRCRSEKRAMILCLLAGLPFCILAGCRDVSIGTDTKLYPSTAFQYALNHDLISMLTQFSSTVEPGYKLLIYVATAIFGNLNWTLGVSQLAIAMPCMFLLGKICPQRAWMGIFVYATVFFPWTLSIIRQSISTGFLLLMFACLLDGRKKLAIALLIVAISIHNSGCLGIVIIVVHELFCGRAGESRLKEYRCLMYLAIAFASILFFGCSDLILRAIIAIKPTYSYHLEHAGTGDISTTVLGLTAVAILAYILYVGSERPEGHRGLMMAAQPSLCLASVTGGCDPGAERGAYATLRQSKEMLCLVCLGACFTCFALISPGFNRLGRSLLFFLIFLLPLLAYRARGSERAVISACSVMVCALYGYWNFVHSGVAEVFPYTSSILGIS